MNLLVLIFAASYLWAPPPSAAAESFNVETLNTDIVWWPSLAVDAGGDAHLAYFFSRGSESGVLYQRRQGGAWLPAEAVASYGSYTSLALDPAGDPHIAYYGSIYYGSGQPAGVPYYASRAGGTWTAEPIDASGTADFRSMSLAFDAQGRPHVAYGWLGSVLKHAVRDNGNWLVEVIDYDFTYDPGVSLRIDSQGNPWVSYHRGTTVLVAHRDAGSWTIETVSDVAAQYLGTSLALDAQDKPSVGYFNNGNFDLRLARRQSGQWTNEVVDAGGGADVSLAVDAAGDPHLSYRDGSNTSLKYAHRLSGTWRINTVDATPGSGAQTSIAIDPTGRPQIAYKFKRPYAGGGALRYAVGPAQAVAGVSDARAGSRLWLAALAPNPSIGRTTSFAIELPAEAQVTLELFDATGRHVASRAPERLAAGSHRLEWNPGVGTPGLYFVRLRTASGTSAQRPWIIVR